MEQIFEYIRDFPESTLELRALRDHLKETRTYKELATTLQKQLRSRLLIPGAHTKDILKIYVRTQKVLEYLLQTEMRLWHLTGDTSDLVVGYLLKRKDAVKCVVAAMLGDDDVLEESEMIDNVNVSDALQDEGQCKTDLDWQPPPFRMRRGEGEWTEDVEERKRSIVQLLVAVFGGREKFLGEFKRMLSSRLLQIGSTYECDREVASLEMMKLKFGEDDLIDCQVMLKDISNSRRINHAVHEVISDNLQNLSALVISRHYWPSPSGLTNSRSFLPHSLESILEEYAAAYHKLRPSQRLEWRRDAGVVDITVEAGDGQTCDFQVSPVQVAVLSLFEGPMTGLGLSVEDVARHLQVSNEAAKRELAFWVNQNMLAEVDVNRFALAFM
jgi:anaphase-promoting complex subunit 2